MADENKNDKTFEMIEIVKDAIVTYNDGDKRLFDAIHITDRGIFTGHILKIDKTDLFRVADFIGRAKAQIYANCRELFIEGGGIPEDNVICIKGGTRRAMFKREHKL